MSRSARSLMSMQRRQLIVQRVDAERVAVQQVRLDHRGEQVVRGADRVDVAGEVEVHVLHRHDLRVAAACGAALDAEHRPERRLAQAERDLLADVAEALRQRHRRRRLALACLRRRDRGDVDQLPVRAVDASRSSTDEVDLRLVAAVRLDLVGEQPGRRGDLRDRAGASPPARSGATRASSYPNSSFRSTGRREDTTNISVWLGQIPLASSRRRARARRLRTRPTTPSAS